MRVINNKFFLLGVSAALCMFFACNNSSGNKSGNDSTSISKESAVAAQSNVDTAAMDNGGSTAPAATGTDTANAVPSTTKATSKTSVAKRNPAKKGHKGHARMAVYTPDYSAKMQQDKEGIYNYAEEKPTFPGGEKALDAFIENNIHYPQDAMDNGVEGTVMVTFAVNEKGKVFSPKLKDAKLGYGLDDEALAAVGKMPRWNPGRVKGKNVKTYYDLPITFTLAD